ncbi:MAG: hypothetical protein ACREVF_09800, partial [Burkholderiales bacterium]
GVPYRRISNPDDLLAVETVSVTVETEGPGSNVPKGTPVPPFTTCRLPQTSAVFGSLSISSVSHVF